MRRSRQRSEYKRQRNKIRAFAPNEWDNKLGVLRNDAIDFNFPTRRAWPGMCPMTDANDERPGIVDGGAPEPAKLDPAKWMAFRQTCLLDFTIGWDRMELIM